MTNSAAALFENMQRLAHCLNVLFPPKKATVYELRSSESSYVLPLCKLSVQRSFVNRRVLNLYFVIFMLKVPLNTNLPTNLLRQKRLTEMTEAKVSVENLLLSNENNLYARTERISLNNCDL